MCDFKQRKAHRCSRCRHDLYKQMANLMVGREVSFEVEKSEPHYRETVLEVKNLTVKNQDHFEVVKNVSFLSTAEKYLPLPEYPAMVKLRLQMRLQELRRQLQVVFF